MMKKLFKSDSAGKSSSLKRKESVSASTDSLNRDRPLPPSVRRARQLYADRDYPTLANHLHKIPAGALSEVLMRDVVPVSGLVADVPGSLVALEVIYFRYYCSDRGLGALTPDAVVRRLCAFLSQQQQQYQDQEQHQDQEQEQEQEKQPDKEHNQNEQQQEEQQQQQQPQSEVDAYLPQIRNVLRAIRSGAPSCVTKLFSRMRKLDEAVAASQRPLLLRRRGGVYDVRLDDAVIATFGLLVKRMRQILNSGLVSATTAKDGGGVDTTLATVESRYQRQRGLLRGFRPVRLFADMARLLAKLSDSVAADELIINEVCIT